MNISKKILAIRLDRMGDVMMTLPSIFYLKQNLPGYEVDFLIQDLYVDVVGPYTNSFGVKPITLSEVRWGEYAAVLNFFSDASIAFSVLKNRIPVRVGVYSKPWSFLCFNSGLRQRRSKAEKNEAVYNLDLARVLVKKLNPRAQTYREFNLTLAEESESRTEAIEHLRDLGLDENAAFIVVHPGMGGSALNLSPQKYIEIIEKLERVHKIPVLLSIGPLLRDLELAEVILKAKPYLRVVRHADLSTLREIFRRAKLVVAPSTGPLHLAHYVGTKTLGIYPPVRSQHPKRWAPWGGSGESKFVYPQVDCPAKTQCLGQACSLYPCMDGLNLDQLPFSQESSLN